MCKRQEPDELYADPQIQAGDITKTWVAEHRAISGENLRSLRGRGAQRTTSIRGKYPVEIVISTLHQHGGTGRELKDRDGVRERAEEKA